jgi:hypothetical protein
MHTIELDVEEGLVGTSESVLAEIGVGAPGTVLDLDADSSEH